MKKGDAISYNLKYSEIKVNKFVQHDLEQEFDDKAVPLLDFTCAIGFKVFDEDEKFGCRIKIMANIIETGEEFCEISVENIFGIQPFEDVVTKKSEEEFDIPDALVLNVANSSISTTRGILHERLKGTIAQKVVFPLLDESTLLDKD